MSVKKGLAGEKFEKTFLWWSRGNVHEKVMALKKNVNVALSAVANSVQQSVLQIAHSVESAFFDHWKWLKVQAEWTKAHFANNLRSSFNCSEASVHREIAWWYCHFARMRSMRQVRRLCLC